MVAVGTDSFLIDGFGLSLAGFDMLFSNSSLSSFVKVLCLAIGALFLTACVGRVLETLLGERTLETGP